MRINTLEGFDPDGEYRLRVGDVGPDVEDWQQQLNLWSAAAKAGVYVAVTGSFDYLTASATMQFQEAAGSSGFYVEPTGVRDDKTASAMAFILDELDAPNSSKPPVVMDPLDIKGKREGFPWGWALFFGAIALAGGGSKR